MSSGDEVRGLVWRYYSPKRCGAPLIMAIALADEANHRGGGIFQSNENLAMKTRQTVRAVRSQLRALEASKVLKCVQRSSGGPGKFSLYELDISALIVLQDPEPASGITRNVVPGLDITNPEPASGFSAPLYKDCIKDKDSLVGDGTRIRVHAEDERLAKWMLERIRALNPKHREPSWTKWLRNIRLLRERDGRTHREIAELFAWANADPFWQSNILSPEKLREKWDQLVLRRGAGAGRAGAAGGAPGAPEDRTCAGVLTGGVGAGTPTGGAGADVGAGNALAGETLSSAGMRCAAPGTFATPDGRWWCAACRDARDRGATSQGGALNGRSA